MNFPKKQAQRLIPEYLLDYTEKLQTSHPDPTESWGGGSGGSYTGGDGIDITNNVISVDNTVAKKSEIPTNYVTLDTEQTITGLKTIGQTSGTISEVDFSGFTFKLSNKAINNPEADIKIRNASYDGYQYPTIYSTKGLYVNLAKIKLGDDGNNTYGITMPDSSTWESDKVLATIDDIPTKTSELTNDSGFITGVTWNDVTGKPTFATVATSGSYNDLTDKPTIPDTTNFVTTDTEQTITGAKTFKGDLKVENTLNCRTMTYDGFGSFTLDINNQGTIERMVFGLPTYKPKGPEDAYTQYTLATEDDIHNPTITFTQGGTTKGTITLNQSGDQTIEFDAGGSSVIANPTLSGDESTLNGIEVDGTKYKVGGGGGKLYLHKIIIRKFYLYDKNNSEIGRTLYLCTNITTSSNQPMSLDTFKQYFTSDTLNGDSSFAASGSVYFDAEASISGVCFNNNFAIIRYYRVKSSSASSTYKQVKFDSVDRFVDTVMEV